MGVILMGEVFWGLLIWFWFCGSWGFWGVSVCLVLFPNFYLDHERISQMTIRCCIVSINFPSMWAINDHQYFNSMWSKGSEGKVVCVSLQKPGIHFLKVDFSFETLFGDVTHCALASLNPWKNCFQVLFYWSPYIEHTRNCQRNGMCKAQHK